VVDHLQGFIPRTLEIECVRGTVGDLSSSGRGEETQHDRRYKIGSHQSGI